MVAILFFEHVPVHEITELFTREYSPITMRGFKNTPPIGLLLNFFYRIWVFSLLVCTRTLLCQRHTQATPHRLDLSLVRTMFRQDSLQAVCVYVYDEQKLIFRELRMVERKDALDCTS